MSFILWFCDSYYYYAATILCISILGITMAVRQTREVLTYNHQKITKLSDRQFV